MSSVVDDDDVEVPQLAHLERCKKCSLGWLSVPYLCKEGSVPTNKHRWYRIVRTVILVIFFRVFNAKSLTSQYAPSVLTK